MTERIDLKAKLRPNESISSWVFFIYFFFFTCLFQCWFRFSGGVEEKGVRGMGMVGGWGGVVIVQNAVRSCELFSVIFES